MRSEINEGPVGGGTVQNIPASAVLCLVALFLAEEWIGGEGGGPCLLDCGLIFISQEPLRDEEFETEASNMTCPILKSVNFFALTQPSSACHLRQKEGRQSMLSSCDLF